MLAYVLMREENIARNKELLKETMLGSGYGDLIKDIKNEIANKRKATRKPIQQSRQMDIMGACRKNTVHIIQSLITLVPEIPRALVLQLKLLKEL